MSRTNLLIVIFTAFCLTACSSKVEDTVDASAETEQTELQPVPTIGGPEAETLGTEVAAVGTTLSVLDISERSYGGRNAIAVMFSHTLDVGQNLQNYFEILTSKDDAVEGAWIVDDSVKTAWFTHTEPNTVYKVSVLAGLPSVDAGPLMQPSQTQITTRSLEPSVSFESQGAILPLGYVSGLPVVTVDIAEIDIDFFRIKDKHLGDFFEQTRYSGRGGWQSRRLKEYGELAFSARFELDAPKHTRNAQDIDLSGFKELEVPGLYLAVMRQAGEYDTRTLTWFSITNIGMHVRQYDGQWDVHLASLTTGAPLPNVTVKALDADNGVLSEHQSDENGVVTLAARGREIRALVAQTEKQFTTLNMRQPSLDLAEFDLGSRPFKPIDLFLYGPRDLYRPGETFVIRGLLRDQDGKTLQSPPLSAEFTSPTHTARHSFLWQSTHSGYYEYTWQIPSDVKTGLWHLEVTLPNQLKERYAFHVEDFLPERLKLDIAQSRDRTVITPGQDIRLPVKAEYLYGAAADGNRLSALLNVQPWRVPFDRHKDYHFGDIQEQNFDPLVELKDEKLDAQGEIELAVSKAAANTWRDATSPLRLMLTASVYESGGRAVNRTHPILYWPFEHVIGIRPHFGDANPSSDSVVKFDLINVDQQGDLHADNTKLNLNLVKEDRQYFWEFSDHRGWSWNWTEKEFIVEQKTVVLNSTETTSISFPVQWGHYRLEAQNAETGQRSSFRFYAGHNWYSDWQNSQNAAPRPDKIGLALDQASYLPGDIAVLNILPPAAGEVLLLVESDKPLWSQKVSVPQQGMDINIPIDPNWQQHDIYVSAMLVQPTGQNVTITPKRSLGLLHLPLNREERRLDVQIQAPERAKPLTILPIDIQVGNAKPTRPPFVNLFAVDVGILNITDFQTPDPHQFFFGQRKYGVDMKDIYADIIEPNNYAKARFKFGGDSDLSRGGAAPRSDVRIVSLYSGLVETDAAGKATIPIQLPDFNGRLRFMAIAHSDTRYGQTSNEVTLASDFIADLSMPRFLATDDVSTLALDIRNMTDAEETVDVQIAVSGAGALLQSGPLEKTLTLKKREKQTLNFSVKATDVRGQATVSVTTQSQDNPAINRTWRIGVRPAYPALTRQQSAVLSKGNTFVLDQARLNKMRLSTTQARIAVAPSVDLRIGDQLRHLLQYPYGCLEQTTSRALPLLYATQDAQTRFQMDALEDEERLTHIQSAIDRILGFQKANGGFGLWDRAAPEEHWLSAYATFFLLQAREQGFNIPENALKKAVSRLESYIQRNGKLSGQRWSEDPQHYAFATKAFSAYVLSEVKRAPLGTLRTLHKNHLKHAKTPLAPLMLSVALKNMGDDGLAQQTLKTALAALPKQLGKVERAYRGDYGSELRDASAMVYLLLKHQLDEGAATQLAVAVRDRTVQREWLSTQEQLMLFLAGLELQKLEQNTWSGQWQAGSSELKVEQKDAQLRAFSGQQLTETIEFTSLSDNPLYVSASINGYSLSAPQAESKGLSIERKWYSLEGSPTTPKKVKSGDAFIVRLTVEADQPTPDALLIDLIPAGFELENQNVGDALDLDALQIENQSLSSYLAKVDIKHQAYRDDRYMAALNLRSNQPVSVFYLIRAVTPGTFSVPNPLVEDMYRPYLRALGDAQADIEITRP